MLQNKAARIVTRLSWGTETGFLLKQVGWLSIKQLVIYHRLILVFKIRRDRKPATLSEKFKEDFAYKTRQATGNCLVIQETPDTDKSKKGFTHNSTMLWNNLPVKIRQIEKLTKFKFELKKWIMQNSPV